MAKTNLVAGKTPMLNLHKLKMANEGAYTQREMRDDIVNFARDNKRDDIMAVPGKRRPSAIFHDGEWHQTGLGDLIDEVKVR